MVKQAKAPEAAEGPRVVNLGDSITDGQTYALLVEQALREAGKVPPHFYAGGIGGDTSAGMLARLDRDVFAFKPQMVMLMTGINDLAGGVTPAQFRTNLCAIADRTQAAGATLMLLTTSNLRTRRADDAMAALNAVIREIAAERTLPLAEVFALMNEARNGRGEDLWEADGAHLNLQGFRYIARAVLDALGHPDVPVPTVQKVDVLPGVIPEWRVRPLAEKETLDTNTVAALRPDHAWTTVRVPEALPGANWWEDQERRRGVVVGLKRDLGPAPGYVAVATVRAPREQIRYVNVGGETGKVWVNGQLVFGKGEPPKGWHPGGYRLPVPFQKGENRIVVSTGSRFFLSVTEDDQW
jgi:lysophospholipase L1-like esterase